jgi:hypothetical protein
MQKLKDTKKDNGWQKRAKTNSESDAGGSPYSRNFISDAVEAALQQARLVKEGNYVLFDHGNVSMFGSVAEIAYRAL